MAESTLSIAYSDIQYEVAQFLGWDKTAANWTSAQNTAFAAVVKRGLRSFYFPPSGNDEKPYYEWSFLKTSGNTTLANATATYVLPDSCSGTVCDFTANYVAASGRRRLSKVPEADIRALQSVDSQTGWPLYFSIRAKAHDVTNGHRYEMVLWPTPSTAQVNAVINYYYVVIPETLAANTYPMGGGLYSEVLLASILAAAEALVDDDPAGPQQVRYTQMLSAAVRDDTNKKASGRGGNT